MAKSVDTVVMQACSTVMELLAERPEQEQVPPQCLSRASTCRCVQFLLALLVNKLGHPNYQVASAVCKLLIALSRRQVNMRGVIVGEMERFIYR
jgi:hypothetical protein